ncbi:MAG: RDD family protein [Myxococcaceae bacterium]
MINGAGLAPLSIRAVAKLIDAVVFVPLFFVAALATLASLGSAAVSYAHAESAQRKATEWLGPAAASAGLGIVAVLAWIGVALVTLYQWHLLISAGQTIGKRFCGVRIVGLDGQQAGFFRALLLRNWVFIALVSLVGGFVSVLIPPAVSLILLLDWALAFGSDRRCLHDHLAGTQVRWVKIFEVRKARVAGAVAAVAALGLGAFVWIERAELLPLLERSRVAAAPVPAPVAVVVAPVVAPVPVVPPAPVAEAQPVPAPAPAPEVNTEPPAPEVAYYQFVDTDGSMHFVDSLEKVPPKLRKTAKVMRP